MSNEYNIKRLSPKEEQGRKAGGRILEKASFIAGGYTKAGKQNQRANYRLQNEEQIQLLKDFANTENLWFLDHDTLGVYIDNGDEQMVYARPEEMMVYKYNDFTFHSDCIEYFDRLALHNYLFPEAPYEMLGFTYSKKDIFSVVVRQPFVVCGRGAYRNEVTLEMSKLGFNHMGGTTYSNADYVIEDLHPGNVLKMQNGHYAFIDPVIFLNTPEEDMGGTRKIG